MVSEVDRQPVVWKWVQEFRTMYDTDVAKPFLIKRYSVSISLVFFIILFAFYGIYFHFASNLQLTNRTVKFNTIITAVLQLFLQTINYIYFCRSVAEGSYSPQSNKKNCIRNSSCPWYSNIRFDIVFTFLD